MKSRFHNNLDGATDMGTYFELPLRRFILQMPQYAGMLANAPIDLDDPKYIVRFRFIKNGAIDLEIGYPEDAEWRIGQPDNSSKLSYPSTYGDIEKLLDEETEKGGSFIVLPLRKYIEMHPDAKKMFERFDIDNKAVCFFRDDKNFVLMTMGGIDNGDDDWKRIIQGCR